jgi:hypothetical protein
MNREEYDSRDDLWRKFHHQEEDPFDGKGKFYTLRQFLNFTFIVLSVIGLIVWFSYSQQIAIFILIGAIGFKFIELTFRILKI